jgi:hypothetical protein
MNGKGDSPRNCFSKEYKSNFDEINWGRVKTIDEVCGNPKGTFKRNLKETEEELQKAENVRAERILKKQNIK